MSGSEEWTRVPSKSHRDRQQVNGRSDRQGTWRNEPQRSAQRREKPEEQPGVMTSRDSSDVGRRQRGGDRVHQEPLSDSQRNPRGILRVPHFVKGAPSQPPACRPRSPPPPPPSEKQLCGDDWPAMVKESDTREAGTKLLWSSVVRTAPQQASRAQAVAQPVAPVSADSSGSEAEAGAGEAAVQKKKRRKKKKKSEGTQAAPVRRFTQPLVIELGSVLQEATEGHQPKVTVVAGAPSQALPKRPVPEKAKDEKSIPRNALDSSAPLVRRGKERETPKKKKPSALKKVIAKEKEEKRKLREQGLSIPADFDVYKLEQKAAKSDQEGHSEIETETNVDDSRFSEPESKADAGGHSETETKAADEQDRVACCAAPKTIHSRMFRNYCDHLVTEEINHCLEQLVTDLVRFQERQYLRDPIKARARKRYVCGLREVAKHVRLKRLKCVIIPPNLDNIQSTGGINSVVEDIIGNCRELNIPVLHGLSRRKLAYLLKKKHKVGCLGIFSYDGAEVWYKQLMELVGKAREEYQLKVALLSVEEDPSALPPAPSLLAQAQETLQVLDLSSASDGASHDEADDECERSDPPEPKGVLESPWKIFFDQGTVAREPGAKGGGLPSDAVGGAIGRGPVGDLGRALNVTASEFVPATPTLFRFNINAEAFVPLTLDSNRTLNS